jgi:hypothetical protein
MESRMPVTAKLSRAFYDKLGDTVVNELVDLLNRMDSGYFTELRQVNELNAARFEARIDQRFAEQDARLAQRFADVDRRFAEQDAKMEKRFAEQDAKMTATFAQYHQSLLRWMLALALGLIVGFSSLFVQIAQR